MHRQSVQLGLGGLLVGLVCATAHAAGALYVSPVGSDAHDGASPERAFASLERARDEVRAAIAAGQLGDGARVVLLPGTHRLRVPLTLGPADSPPEGASIVWEGSEGTVVSGAVPVPSWERQPGSILRCDLGALGLTASQVGAVSFRGRRMEPARWPNRNADDVHGGEWGYVAKVEGGENVRSFAIEDPKSHEWAHPERGTVSIFSGYDWAYSVVAMESFDRASGLITLAGNTWCPIRLGDRLVLTGLREELDAPGEWYADPDDNTLLFLPPEGAEAVAPGEVEVAVASDLFILDGCARLTVRRLGLEAVSGEALSLRGSTDCRVEACRVRLTGAWGLSIRGGARCAIVGCDVTDCGHGGISVDGGDRTTLARGEHLVDNNHVWRCGVTWKTYRPGVSVTGVGNTVSHNLIHDLPHAGLLLAGNDNIVEFNVVHHVNLESTDTGGLYFCSRDWTQRGNEIRWNVFHHIGGFGKANSWAPLADGKVEFRYPHFTWGIYLDDPTTGTRVFGNILYAVPVCGLHNHGGRDNTWENNVLIDCPAINEGALWNAWSEWPSIYERLRERTQPGSPYLERYPELARIAPTRPEEMSGVRFLRNIVRYTHEGTEWLRRENGGQIPLYQLSMSAEDFAANEWDGNCVSWEDGLDVRVRLNVGGGPSGSLTWEEWRALAKDATSRVADPLFVDAAAGDWRLRPESPALALGFQQIPVERIGPYEDEARASWPVDESDSVAVRGVTETVRSYEPSAYKPLPAVELQARGGLPHAIAKARAGRPLRVAYFGGGIHGAGGWRGRLLEALRAEGATIEEVDASVTDATRSLAFSAFRFGHDVLAHRPDLVVVDFAADDAEGDLEAARDALDGVVQQAWSADPTIDFLFVYAFRSGFEMSLEKGLCSPSVSAHERVAEHYAIPSLNLGVSLAELWKQGTLLPTGTPEQAEAEDKLLFSTGGRAPTGEADALYGETVTRLVRELLAATTAQPGRSLPSPLSSSCWADARQYPITPEMLSGEWTSLPPEDPDRASIGRHVDSLWLTRTPGAKLKVRFRGTHLSILDLMGPDTGKVRLTLDGTELGERQQIDRWCTYQRLGSLWCADGIAPGEHTLTLELLPDAPDRSEAIAAARESGQYRPEAFEGVALRLGAIRVRGEVLP